MLGSRSRTDFATSTALAPARRNTATTTVADGTLLAANPEAHVDAFVLHAVLDLGNVFQIHRRAVALADDQVVVSVRRRSVAPCGCSRNV